MKLEKKLPLVFADWNYWVKHLQSRGWFRNCAIHSTAEKSTYVQFSYMKSTTFMKAEKWDAVPRICWFYHRNDTVSVTIQNYGFQQLDPKKTLPGCNWLLPSLICNRCNSKSDELTSSSLVPTDYTEGMLYLTGSHQSQYLTRLNSVTFMVFTGRFIQFFWLWF